MRVLGSATLGVVIPCAGQRGAWLVVHEVTDIDCRLVAQRVVLPERHLAHDKSGGCIGTCHAGADVERGPAPDRRKRISATAVRRAGAVRTMAASARGNVVCLPPTRSGVSDAPAAPMPRRATTLPSRIPVASPRMDISIAFISFEFQVSGLPLVDRSKQSLIRACSEPTQSSRALSMGNRAVSATNGPASARVPAPHRRIGSVSGRCPGR